MLVKNWTLFQRFCMVERLTGISLSRHFTHETPILRSDNQDESLSPGQEEKMYGYAKRLEFKNRRKEGYLPEDELRYRVYRTSLTSEQSVLAMDLLRKHKAMSRDVKRLRRLTRKSPEAAEYVSSFKPEPFGHCEPTSTNLVASVIKRVNKIRTKEEEVDLVQKRGSGSPAIPVEEKESVGSLEGLKLKDGIVRPSRPPRSISAFRLPLSRPSIHAFHRVRPSTMDALDMHFAEWFIGITEAQSPFKYTAQQRPYFAIEHMDLEMFRRIRAKIHFGHFDDVKQVWYVIDDKNLPRLIHLLNGNLFLQGSRDEFKIWVDRYRQLGTWKDEGFQIDMSCGWRPQLNNKWLMGFIDSSRGMFAARLIEAQSYPYFRINLKFWILHHDQSFLEYLVKMFGGGEIDRDGDSFRWTIKERRHHSQLNMYCRLFRSMSLKHVNTVRYDRLVHYPFVKVKTSASWRKLQTLVENLNKYERKLALSMRFHPYHERYKSTTQLEMELARQGVPVDELKLFSTKERKKNFPLWETPKYLSLIKEVN